MQLHTVYLSLETALHVSGGISTHHQEHTQLYLQNLARVKPLLLPAAIMEELEHQFQLCCCTVMFSMTLVFSLCTLHLLYINTLCMDVFCKSGSIDDGFKIICHSQSWLLKSECELFFFFLSGCVLTRASMHLLRVHMLLNNSTCTGIFLEILCVRLWYSFIL